jgi:NAD(P)-dependent dehydrogenase (short-subunit alcohol dehydrogenase family)
MNPTYNFKGQVALVTGASAGIDLARAQAFAQSGAAVVLADRNGKGPDCGRQSSKTPDIRRSECHAMSATRAQAASMVERTVATFGRIDMAYNNAGILGPMCRMMEETAAGFDEVNAVNLRGVGTCVKHELLQMRKQGAARSSTVRRLAALSVCRDALRTTRPNTALSV